MTTTQRSTAKNYPKNSHVGNISNGANQHTSVATRCSIRKPLLLAFVLIVGVFFLYEVIMVGNFSTGDGAAAMENKAAEKHAVTAEKGAKIRQERYGILKKQLEELKKIEAETKVDKNLNQIQNDEKVGPLNAENGKEKINRNGNEHVEANKKEGDVLPGEDNKALLHKLTGKHQDPEEEEKFADKEEEVKIANKLLDKENDQAMGKEEAKTHDAIDNKSKKENEAVNLNANNKHKEEAENEKVEPAKENEKEVLEDENSKPLRNEEQKIEDQIQKAANQLFVEQAEHKEEIGNLVQKQDQKLAAVDKFSDKEEDNENEEEDKEKQNAAEDLIEKKEENQKKDNEKEEALIGHEIKKDDPRNLLNKGERIENEMQKAVNKLLGEQEEHEEEIDHAAQKQDQKLAAAEQFLDKKKEDENVKEAKQNAVENLLEGEEGQKKLGPNDMLKKDGKVPIIHALDAQEQKQEKLSLGDKRYKEVDGPFNYHPNQKEDVNIEHGGDRFEPLLKKEKPKVAQELPRTRPKHEFGEHPFFSGKLMNQRAKNPNVESIRTKKPLTIKKMNHLAKEMEHPFFKGKLRTDTATKNEKQKEKLF